MKSARKYSALTLILFILGLIVLAGCSGSDEQPRKMLKLTEIPGVPIDPSDQILQESIHDALTELQAPPFSTFESHRLDLDGDGRRDALVLFRTPYGFWCDQHGCAMMVMKASDNDFTLVNVIQPIRPPLYVSTKEENGWKTLIARVSGRWDKAKDVEISYDGQSYASNPANLEPAAGVEKSSAMRLFVD